MFKPNIVLATAGHYATLLAGSPNALDLSNLNLPCSGGERLTEDAARNISETIMKLGAPRPIIVGYGMSEFGCMITTSFSVENRSNEAGRVMPFIEVRVVSPGTNEVLECGTPGEIQALTPCIMKGYLNMPENTADMFALDEDGNRWAKTNDIGFFTEDGVLHICGRKSDGFRNADGEMVWLFEYENIVSRHPDVIECAVVTMEINGESHPVIHIVRKPESKHSADEVILAIHKMLQAASLPELPYAYKIRERFDVSLISGKRDTKLLQRETDGFLQVIENCVTPLVKENN